MQYGVYNALPIQIMNVHVNVMTLGNVRASGGCHLYASLNNHQTQMRTHLCTVVSAVAQGASIFVDVTAGCISIKAADVDSTMLCFSLFQVGYCTWVTVNSAATASIICIVHIMQEF